MKRQTVLFALLGSLFFLTSCDPVIDSPVPDSGNADFSVYLALGNSLTAGFADNALYREGQLVSYPNLLAGQFKAAGGGPFQQPLVAAGPGSGPEGNARLVLGLVNGNLAPIPAASQGQNIFEDRLSGPFQNLGVPGARSFHLLAEGYGNPACPGAACNPYFVRFASQANASVLSDALAQNPTFFTLWIGNNDVLGYGLSGGTGATSGINNEDITPEALFEQSLTTLVSSLAANGRDGALLNIPDITAIPYFTTIPWNAVELNSSQAQVFRNQFFSNGVPAQYIPDFQAGLNGLLIEDPDLTDRAPEYRFRLATENDFVLLVTPQDSLRPAPLGPGWGTTKPIPDRYTLRAPQAAHIAHATRVFNTIIRDLANQYDLVYADVNGLLERVRDQGGINFDGMELSLDFVSGGIFSLDGVHLTDRGNAIVANFLIEAINRHYQASVSPVNIGDFQGVRFP